MPEAEVLANKPKPFLPGPAVAENFLYELYYG